MRSANYDYQRSRNIEDVLMAHDLCFDDLVDLLDLLEGIKRLWPQLTVHELIGGVALACASKQQRMGGR